jgi:hypothetical protein
MALYVDGFVVPVPKRKLAAGPAMNKVQFSFSKPTAGWPVGDYRVDLFLDGKKATDVKFKVAK